jgi:hypothetical protein
VNLAPLRCDICRVRPAVHEDGDRPAVVCNRCVRIARAGEAMATQRRCIGCGGAFAPTNPRQRHCRPSCKQKQTFDRLFAPGPA